MQQWQPTVLVIGDVVLAVHLVGTLKERLAAGVTGDTPADCATAPVFRADSQYDVLSGAAGIACDLRALGCNVRLLSVVGADAAGRRSRELLRSQHIADTLVLEDIGRPTAQRTHLRGEEGPVLCLDRQRQVSPSRALTARLFECLDTVLPQVDGILCAEDVTCLGEADLARLLSAAQAASCPVFVGSDAKWSRCQGTGPHPANGSVSLIEIVQELQQCTQAQTAPA